MKSDNITKAYKLSENIYDDVLTQLAISNQNGVVKEIAIVVRFRKPQ